jgi:apolipoprotein N-acyltransferase
MGAVAQTASLVGMTSLTFWIVIWAALPALCFERRRPPAEVAIAIVLALTLPAALAWGTWRLAHSDVGTVEGVSLRIVQPNIPQDEKWLEGSARTIFSTLIDLSSRKDAEGKRQFTHLIWPESAVPFYLEESDEARTIIATLVGEKGLLITGNLRREPVSGGEPRVFNSVLGFDGSGNLVLRYDKWRLVPGGEFLPLAWLLEPLGFRKVVTVPGSFEAGSGPHSLPVPGAPEAGFLICYEVVFPDRLVDGTQRPRWLVNVTNDGWFGHTSGPYQHLAQAQLRAIEQGLPIVRAANSGISAIIDPYGRVLQSLALGTQGIIDAPLPEAIAPPFYARLGDLLLVAEIIVAILLVAVLSLAIRGRD